MTDEMKHIVQMANKCGISVYLSHIGKQPTHIDGSYRALEAFYKLAQAEAFELAAAKCNETREIEDHWDGGTTTVHKYFYRDDCIAAIREMAKEMK